MSTGRFRFSIAQPVRKNHPRPRLSVWAGAGSRQLQAAAAPLLQSGYIMGYYANILCPAARAPGSRGRWCSCVRCRVRLLAMFHGLVFPPHRLAADCLPALASPGIGAGSWGCRFLFRLNTAAISREHYKLTRVASYYIICDGLQENTKNILKHRAKG